MNCQRFEQVVSDLARGQMIEADVRTEALAHSAQCESCLARLRDEEALTRGLRFLAADMESLGAPDAIELNLRQAFRQRQVPVRVSARGLTRTRYWLVAVAAMLLVAVTAAAMWWRSPVRARLRCRRSPRISGSPSPACTAGSSSLTSTTASARV